MCRKNLIPAAALIGFGAGVWLGLFIESSLLRLVVGAAAIGVALWLVKYNCHA